MITESREMKVVVSPLLYGECARSCRVMTFYVEERRNALTLIIVVALALFTSDRDHGSVSSFNTLHNGGRRRDGVTK